MAPSISWDELLALPTGELTLSQIDTLKAQGWDAASTGLSHTYRSSWTLWHGFREFVQNTLDETGTAAITVDRHEGHVATFISDEGKGFGVQALLLGERKTETPESIACLRGRFGEGMKIGVLPILRAGGRVFIRTTDLDLAFVLGEARLAGQLIKALLVLTRRNDVVDGTIVAIEGLDASNHEGQDLRSRFAPTLALLRPDDVLHTVRGGPGPHDACQVRQIFRRPGEIYVRDIFVEKQDHMIWGYNFWFGDSAAALDPNRDHLKHGPTSLDMNREISLLLATMPEATLRTYLVSFRGQKESFEWRAVGDAVNYWIGSRESKVEFLKRLHGVIATSEGTSDFSWSASHEDAKALEHLGTTDLADVYPSEFLDPLAHADLVRKPVQIRQAVGAGHLVVHERDVIAFIEHYADLQDPKAARQTVLAFRGAVRRLQELAAPLVGHPVPVAFYVGSGDQDDRKAGGFTDHKTIFIHVRQLSATGWVLETFIHEAAHVSSGADDLTDAFEHALVRVGIAFAQVFSVRRAWVQSLNDDLRTLREEPLPWKSSGGTVWASLPSELIAKGYEFLLARQKTKRRGVQGLELSEEASRYGW